MGIILGNGGVLILDNLVLFYFVKEKIRWCCGF